MKMYHIPTTDASVNGNTISFTSDIIHAETSDGSEVDIMHEHLP